MPMILRVDDLKRNRRRTVSGALIIEPKPARDVFEYEAAGCRHPGETYREHRERLAKRWRAVRQAAVVLCALGVLIALVSL